MPINKNRKTVGIEEEVFVVPEVTAGTPVFPAGADVVRLIASPDMNQNLELLTDEQRRFTHSQLSRPQGRVQAGTFNINCYLKTEGVLGTEPEAHELLEGAYGTSVTTPATSVLYDPLAAGNAMPTYTIWHYYGNTEVRMMTGCVVNEAAITIKAANDQASLMSGNFTGMGVRMKRAAQETIASDVAPAATTVSLDDARHIQTETFIQFNDDLGGVDDNGGSGYEVLTVDYGADTFTTTAVVTGVTAANNGYIEPFRPTAVESGSIRHGSIGVTTLGGESLSILQATININNQIQIPNEVQDGSVYPSADCIVRAGKREVTGEIQVYFTPETSKQWYQHFSQEQNALLLQVNGPGTAPVTAYKFNFPVVELDAPAVTGDEIKTQSFGFIALGTGSGENEADLDIVAP